MDISLKDTRITLSRDGLIALRDAGGSRITCLEGALWITQECSIKDEVLGPGQTLRLRHDGLTLVTALAPSALTLSEDRGFVAAVREALPHRLATRLQRLIANWLDVGAAHQPARAAQSRDSRWGSDHFVRAI